MNQITDDEDSDVFIEDSFAGSGLEKTSILQTSESENSFYEESLNGSGLTEKTLQRSSKPRKSHSVSSLQELEVSSPENRSRATSDSESEDSLHSLYEESLNGSLEKQSEKTEKSRASLLNDSNNSSPEKEIKSLRGSNKARVLDSDSDEEVARTPMVKPKKNQILTDTESENEEFHTVKPHSRFRKSSLGTSKVENSASRHSQSGSKSHVSDFDESINSPQASMSKSRVSSDKSDNNSTNFANFEKTYDAQKDVCKETNNDSLRSNLFNKGAMIPSRISNEYDFEHANILSSTVMGSPVVKPKEINEKNFSVINEASTMLLNESMRTPRKSMANVVLNSDEESDDDDVIELSSDADDVVPPIATPLANRTMKQQSLKEVVKKMTPPVLEDNKVIALESGAVPKLNVFSKKSPTESNKIPIKYEIEQHKPSRIEVNASEYETQHKCIRNIESDLSKVKNLLRTLKLDGLPDGGKQLVDKFKLLTQNLINEKEKLSKMVISKAELPPAMKPAAQVKKWENLEAGLSAVQPKTFGKKGLANYAEQKALTADMLENMHGSLKNCPTEDDLAEDPKGLKVELMPHQKRAIKWLMYREKQKPAGGILADDMGLGKTLTMIALILKSKQESGANSNSDEENTSPKLEQRRVKHPGGTLVVCPASLLNQWSGEIERRLKRGLLSFEIYHGPKRETKPRNLAKHDVVITTYSIAQHEYEEGVLFRIKWDRIILDEAHQIRNHKSITSQAVCSLSAKLRWALTGTPVQNKELDMYALIKFLRCSPFDSLPVWKQWVSNKSAGGTDRLYTVISSLMLRRTKAELMESKVLTMPNRKWDIIPITLGNEETMVYQKVMLFSRTMFSQFLHQRAEKNQEARDVLMSGTGAVTSDPNGEYFKMRELLLKKNKLKEISQHQILVLLLRLRQICCHPHLMSAMLTDEEIGDEEDEDVEEKNLLDQLNDLNLEDDHFPAEGASEESVGFTEAAKGFLNKNNAVFSAETVSSKIHSTIELIKDKIMPREDKVIVVSQWRSFLTLLGTHLKNHNIKFDQLDGTVPTAKRMSMVDNFNHPKSNLNVLLLSLTAGGVGLNLVGANHLILLDLHWNPQLENQAQDRIYRVGQKKEVFVYKFMASDTIEERIYELQQRKLEIANSMLTGSKAVISNKLTLADMKMLFS